MATNNSINNAVKVTTYIASNTWTKDTRAQWVKVYLWGPGQGGGSGRKGATTAAGGGGGGCGGSFCFVEGPASIFDTSQTVTIGGTVTGALGVTTDSTNGNGLSATSVGATTLGNNIQSSSGGASFGGTATTASHSAGVNGFGIGIGAPGSSNGGGGSNTAPSNPSNVAISAINGTGGGGGSGADLVTERQAATGAPRLKIDASTTLIAGGTGGLESGTIGGGTGVSTPAASTMQGILGGGGGGGGGALNDGSTVFASGAGGNGARGQIIVIEFLS